ncbi:MAG: hypothetical protein C4617_03145 [Candidatus Liberibacter europaeus]|uniref:TadE-like domain-containing protein n=1 Tax=Candidatus Liberibacter europaeus TaxID=744859 RepID=A0A2T4VYF6_9HYPH|nr:hypothetical protein [Candidatus Liberibacter europaeus]PTL86809.1 MAG: hypothetical protein C4617_03145 [Candidatus Liberibacter europaeus]
MKNGLFKCIERSIMIREGSVAIEFAILVLPYFLVVFAILEICICFSAEQLFENAAYSISRQIRTGELNTKNTKMEQLRKNFCHEIRFLIFCSDEELRVPYDFYIDVKQIKSLKDIPVTIPRKGSNYDDEIDGNGFSFQPGGAGTYNYLRAFYHWPILTNLMVKYMSTVKHAGKRGDYLMVSTVVFKNEPFDS